MRRLNLLNLLKTNAKRGEFRAEANTIFIYDIIVGSDDEAAWFGGISPQAFQRELAAMSGPVHIRINSPGGEVFAARAIAQAMREYDGEVITHVDGVAASAASVIAVAGSKCIMAPGSMMMIHRAWTIALGNSADFRACADLMEKIDSELAKTYADRSGQPADSFATAMAAETWYTPEEALAAGLADEVAASTKAGAKSAAQACARWDLSAYGAPPQIDPAKIDPTPSEPGSPPIPTPAPVAQVQEPQAEPEDDHEARARRHAVRLLATTA